MIKVNDILFDWKEGLTLKSVIKMYAECGKSHITSEACFYLVNKTFVQPSNIDKVDISDGDVIKIMPVVSGG